MISMQATEMHCIVCYSNAVGVCGGRGMMLYSRMEGAAIAVLMGGGERIADRYISHQVSPHTACGASTQPLPPPPLPPSPP